MHTHTHNIFIMNFLSVSTLLILCFLHLNALIWSLFAYQSRLWIRAWNLIYSKQKHWLTDEWPKEIVSVLCVWNKNLSARSPFSQSNCMNNETYVNEWTPQRHMDILNNLMIIENKKFSYHKNRSQCAGKNNKYFNRIYCYDMQSMQKKHNQNKSVILF